MSCRVLKREMEYAMMDVFIHKCQQRGILEIRGYYYPTEKNGMVKSFYKMMNFDLVSEKEDETVWSYVVNDSYKEKNKYIQVEE